MYSSRRRSLLGGGLNYSLLLTLSALLFLYHLQHTSTLFSSTLHDAASPQSPSVPKIIWRKLDTQGFTPAILESTNTCMSANPDHDIQFLSDDDAADFVSTAFAHRPDILATYFGLTLSAVRLDLLRYMLLYDQGGVWLDAGASCSSTPIDEWIPPQHAPSTSLMLGRDSDAGRAPSTPRRFASWVIVAKPGSPHMLAAVEDVVAAVQQTMRFYGVDAVENVTAGMTGDAGSFSGPGRLTRAVVRSLEETMRREVDGDEVSAVLMPQLVGDVLVMPRHSFSTSGGLSGEEEELGMPTLGTMCI
jgi:alpha 1,6-mannosyltransferase